MGDYAGETKFPAHPPARHITGGDSTQDVEIVQTRIGVLVSSFRSLLCASIHLQKYSERQ